MSNVVAERRLRRKAKPVLDRYVSGEIDFEAMVTTLQEIDDAAEYEKAAAEEVGDEG